MKKAKAVFHVLFLLAILPAELKAQEVFPSTGGEAEESRGTVSYTLGQVLYSTNTGTGGIVTQGVQQPYEIVNTTGIEEDSGISLECIVFPNPATDLLKLRFENHDLKDLSYQLSDLNGKIVQIDKIENNGTIIHLENLSPSVYFLKITRSDTELTTFKIIKN